MKQSKMLCKRDFHIFIFYKNEEFLSKQSERKQQYLDDKN
jgi:hypothetical protein